jgi:hypothetical protein
VWGVSRLLSVAAFDPFRVEKRATCHLRFQYPLSRLLFRASAETLLEVARDPKHLGGNRLLHRAAYLESEAQAPSPCPLRHSRRWAVARSHPLGKITRTVLSSHLRAPRVFRGKFVAALRQAFRDHQLVFHGNLTLLAQPSTFAAWLRPLFITKTGWSIRSHLSVAPSMCSSIWVATPIA